MIPFGPLFSGWHRLTNGLAAFSIALLGLVPKTQGQFTVSNTNSSGAGSLSAAISSADANPGSTINFANNLGIITLTAALPVINASVTINGGIGNTVSGASLYQVFFVNSGTVGINNLTIINGNATGGSGGNGSSGGGGAAGLGGALLVNRNANVTLTGVSFLNNEAIGGAGGGNTGGNVGSGGGGGIGGSASGSTGGNGGNFGGTGGTASGLKATDGGSGAGGGGNYNAGNGGFGGGGGGGGPSGMFGYGYGGNGGFGGGGGGYGGNPAYGFGGGFGGGNSTGNYGSGGGAGGGAGLGGAVFVVAGGTLGISGGTVSGNTVTGGGSNAGMGDVSDGGAYGSGFFLNGSGTLTLNPGAGVTGTIADVIADQNGNGGVSASNGMGGTGGAWGVTHSGAGTTILTGANTYTGTTTLASGVLNAGAPDVPGVSGALGVGASIYVTGGNITFTGGTLQYSAANQADYSSRILNSTGAISIDTNGQSVIYSSTLDISNTGGLTKLGVGTLALAAANNYTGPTTVKAGTLVVSGSIAASSSVNVAHGAIVGGSGSVGAISGAGLVAPGDPQILTATQVDPSLGLSFAFSLTQPGSPAYDTASASGNDVLHLTDSIAPFFFTLTSANTITVDFSGATLLPGQTYLGGFFTDAAVPNAAVNRATFDFTGTNGAKVQYEGFVTEPNAAFATGTVTNGEVMEFLVMPAPEPGSAMLLMLGGGAMLSRRCRQSQSRKKVA